jgi:DNA helicase II / ATP-dependent DNA helicase PcrA
VFLPLNPAQTVAKESVDGNYVVIAGPGSGKSTVVVQRYLEMLRRGIPERDILNLTFTAEAAKNMVEKVGLLNAEKVFRTFHSYALDLMKREREFVPFPLCDTIIPVYGQDYELLKNLMKTYPAIGSFRTLKERIAEWKCQNISPEEAIYLTYNNGAEFFYAAAYRDYERRCREDGWLDFDSLMRETVKLLKTNAEVRQRNKKKYIQVDESQDCDVCQGELLNLICGGNIFFVGDPNQLVYEWRSAQQGNMEEFVKQYDAKTLYLGQNYRSTKKLVAWFKRILPVDNGIASHMISEREEGIDPLITKFEDEMQEANVVLQRITDPNNSAIIARTNRQLLFIQKRCMAKGIKSVVLGKKNLWQQTEVAHLLKLAKEKQHTGRPAHEVLAELIARHNLMYLYRNSGNPMEKDPAENLNDLTKMAANKGTIPEFLAWLRRLTYASKSKKTVEQVVTLSTVHQMKGRQAKHIFLVGVNQNLMPHKNGEIEEEKRIFFVGATRAADTLEISFYGNRSQFLNDFQDEIKVYEAVKNDSFNS